MSELQNNVVLVKSYEQRSSQKPIKTGTGFFVDTDGSVLTCFHVVGEPKSKKLYDWITITFNGEEREVACIFSPPVPEELDFAILRPKDHKLPNPAELIQLGEWNQMSKPPTAFQTFGHSLLDTFEGLFGEGIIRGKVHTKFSGNYLLQLTSQTIGAEDIQPGMSGAPVFDKSNEIVVGMINVLYKDQRNNIPFAIPIDQVAEKWEPIRMRLLESKLFQDLEEKILSDEWFTDVSFASFYQSLPIPGLIKYEHLRGGKREQLLAQIRGRKAQIYDFANYFRLKRPDIPLDLSILPPVHHINFVNREMELKEACDLFAPPYLLFDAPSGYGKTELLKAIQRHQFRDNWIGMYIKAQEDHPVSATKLAQQIATQADFHDSLKHLSSLEAMGLVLGGHLYQHFSPQNRAVSGLVLLIDNVECLPESEIDGFVNQFLPALQNALRHVPIRIRFAGRNVGSRWIRHSTKFPIKIIPLSPFRLKFVQETVKRLLPSLADHDTFAAHLMHVTGGHPGCMAEIIEGARVDYQTADDFFHAHEDEHQNIVLKYAQKTREAIPENLRNIFDVLSVFRRYNLRLLQKMMDEKLIEYSHDVLSLERELTSTYLVKRKHGFIQDEIVRRLLAIRLRWEEPQRYLDLCQKARDIYFQDLQSPDSREEQHIAIEGLFGELLIAFYQSNQSCAQRKLLKDSYFVNPSTLQKYLSLLNEKKFALEIKQNLIKLLEDENGEEDWEFRFLVNFFLRSDQFNNQPFDELLKYTKAF